jgi:uncharacterized membrane protein
MNFRPLIQAGLLIGIGLGGFLDGIVLHQILQWHNMMSNRVPVEDLISAKQNMVWDGYFHLGVWIVSVWGIIALFQAGRREDVVWSGRIFTGSWLLGWGLFNIVESVVDHYILRLHNVHEYVADKDIYNHLFLAGPGFLLATIGATMIIAEKRTWVGRVVQQRRLFGR